LETPKALANLSPGFEWNENPVVISDWFDPRVVAALQPWAGISERLRR